MAGREIEEIENEDSGGGALLLALGLGALAGWVFTSPGKNTGGPSYKDLSLASTGLQAFQKRWESTSDRFDDRRKMLGRYHLEKTIQSLSGEIQQAYIESLNCFLFGFDIASANMIGLSIELLLRNKTGEEKKSLFDLVEDLEARKIVSAPMAKTLHLLRQIRNMQSHTLNKPDELELLSLFKAVGDIQKLVI
jgi:hypothetical protein